MITSRPESIRALERGEKQPRLDSPRFAPFASRQPSAQYLASMEGFGGQEHWEEIKVTTTLYVVLMAAVIAAVDLLFFKNRFWERLTVNVGIVLIFAAFYFRFLKRP